MAELQSSPDIRIDGLNNCFQQELEQLLRKMDEERRKKKTLFNRTLLILISLFSLIALVMYFINFGWFMSIAMPLFFLVIVMVEVHGFIFKDLELRVKKLLMESICNFLGLQYRLKPRGIINIKTFTNLGLISSDYNRKHIEDELQGSYKGVEFSMMEAKLLKVYQSKRHGTSTVFSGILLSYTFAKPFKGTTWVLTESLFNGIEAGERVKLEDPEFEKLFDVYSSDQIEARYILTPGFMERIKSMNLEFMEIHGIDMVFQKNKLYLTLLTYRNFFEAGSMDSALHDPERFKKIAQEVYMLFTIPETLKLGN